MNFDLSEEQVLLRDAVASYLSRHWDQDRHNNGGPAARESLWSGLSAELGLMAVTAPEEAGGMGGGIVELTVIAQELGRALALEGFIPTLAYGGTLFRETGDAARIAALAEGDMRIAIAHSEPGLLPGGTAVAARADGTMQGTKTMVAGAPIATHLVVSAMEPEQRDFSLFLLPANAPGVTTRRFDMIDGQPAAELTFEGTPVPEDARIGAPGQGLALHRHAADIATIAHTAEAVGMMEALVRITADYLAGRKQFGQPLAQFQALQHRMADMVLGLEDSRSLLYMAALTDPADPTFEQAVTGMKVKTAEALRFVSQQAVQLHGGMGITDELMVGHYFKRAMVVNEAFGGPDHYRARYEASLG